MQQPQYMIPNDEQQSTKMCPPKKHLPYAMPAKPKKLTRSKSDGAAYCISRASSRTAATSSSPSSPESVVTYLGRSYSFKDLFPDLDLSSLGDLNSDSEENEDDGDTSDTDNEQVQQQQQREEVPIKQIMAPARVLRRNPSTTASTTTVGEAATGKKSPMRPRRVIRTKSAGPGGVLGRKILPARSKSSEDLSHMMAAVQNRQKEKEEAASKPPGLLRSTTLNAVKSIFGDNSDADIHDEEKKFGIYSNSIRTLNYTQVDVANICDDHQEFERLKATLKKQGAITNEVLKQGLHFYVQAKKDRDANPQSRGGSSTGHRRRRRIPARRTRSDDQEANESATSRTTGRPAVIKRSGTTGIIL